MRPRVNKSQASGVKIPKTVQWSTEQRILKYANAHYAGKFTRLDIRFHGALCYVDAYTEPAEPSPEFLSAMRETREEYLERLRKEPVHLCRLRYSGREDRWSMAFYTYSNDKYEPCVFDTGDHHGTPEEAFETAAMYLQD